MGIRSICRDKVCLLKKDGTKYDNVIASVQSKVIFVTDTSLPIEEGDQFVRALPNGIKEVFDVIDPVYYGNHPCIEPHYQVKVSKVLKHKEELKDKEKAGYVIQVTGSNSRVNVSSTDNSINIDMKGITDENIFEKLRECITAYSENEERGNLLSMVDDLEKTRQTDGYKTAYKSFIENAKDIITIISPFIPVLSTYLI